MLKEVNPNQIVLTQTVKYLLSGAGLTFAKLPSSFQFQENEALYLVSDNLIEDRSPYIEKHLQRNDSFLENILQIIEQHMSNELFGVEMLCREVGLSERQLQRKLKAVTNKSPNQLITSVRLHRAKELLLKSDGNIAEIGYKTGFASPSYFSKCFKKEFGTSPSDLLS
jgi:transcriptional regulator GlxA family with amidase domain